VTFDSNQPTVTLSTPRFTWTSSEPANFECSLDRFRTLEPCGSGITGSWQRYKLDGDYVLSVRGRDNSGNTGAPARHSFRVGKFKREDKCDFVAFYFQVISVHGKGLGLAVK
jgi:hypothetical protein